VRERRGRRCCARGADERHEDRRDDGGDRDEETVVHESSFREGFEVVGDRQVF
jgi:hypothetical protein